MKRDLYIDFAKGLATLSIIFIHTAFWSGQFYVPTEIRVLSLVFDVPLFYALSGITSGSNLEKTFYRLLKLQITYMIFVTLLFFADYLFKVVGLYFYSLESLQHFYSIFGSKYVPLSISAEPQWQNLGNWYLHSYTNADTFPVVMGSFWYLKVYFILAVFGVLILKFFPRHILWFVGLCFGLTLIFNLFPQYYPGGQVGYVAFYLGLFLVAHLLRGRRLSGKMIAPLYGIFFIILLILWWMNGGDLFLKMNKAKFPPKLLYIFWCSFSIITLFAFYNRLKISKNNWVTYIGKNAIFFYFAQGISSSLMYFLVVPLKDVLPWFVLMIFIFIVNVMMAFVLAEMLKAVDRKGWLVLEFLRRISASRQPR